MIQIRDSNLSFFNALSILRHQNIARTNEGIFGFNCFSVRKKNEKFFPSAERALIYEMERVSWMKS
jgi:hypothetical protein